jgi:hypothetical protein
VIVAWLATAWAGTVGGAAEVDLVGPLGVGPRVEVTGRLSPGDGGQRVIGALGAIPTAEYVYLPLTVGWRSTGRTDRTWAPVVGAGMQLQTFVLSDAPVRARHAWYGEAGARVSASDQLSLSAVVSPELTTFGVPGIGLAVRIGAAFGR